MCGKAMWHKKVGNSDGLESGIIRFVAWKMDSVVGRTLIKRIGVLIVHSLELGDSNFSCLSKHK
jgi:hypothetical protein